MKIKELLDIITSEHSDAVHEISYHGHRSYKKMGKDEAEKIKEKLLNNGFELDYDRHLTEYSHVMNFINKADKYKISIYYEQLPTIESEINYHKKKISELEEKLKHGES